MAWFVYFLLCAQITLDLGHSSLHSAFKHFEELKPEHISVRVKRDGPTGRVASKLVSFLALQRKFVIDLTPGSPVLHPQFQASLVDGEGRMTPFKVDRDTFYAGFLNGNPEHGVDAVYVEGVWIAQIHAPEGGYSIEPLRRHDPRASPTSMLIYRWQDVQPLNDSSPHHGDGRPHPFCEQVRFPASNLKFEPNTTPPHGHLSDSLNAEAYTGVSTDTLESRRYMRNLKTYPDSTHHGLDRWLHIKDRQSLRRRRETPKPSNPYMNTCEMLAVADFKTYRGIGEGSALKVISFLINVYQSANRIFRATIFGEYTNMGLVVKSFLVFSSYTRTSIPHFNMANNMMEGRETLISMTTVPYFSKFCLVHLTTERNFGGTLGLASTASEKDENWDNGICSMTQTSESRNIGLSTPITASDSPLSLAAYTAVVSHELGHNWGSEHDTPENLKCSPPTKDGGKYLMWAYAGVTFDKNSNSFSPCSRGTIGGILQKKAHLCFRPQNVKDASFCGNGVQDVAEDCDVGYTEKDDDKCCADNCRFRENAICSPFNHPCCTDACQVAPPTQTCVFDVTNPCQEESQCSGNASHTCPYPRLRPNNSTCGDDGICWHGTCLSYCVNHGLKFSPRKQLETCSCDTDRTTMCYHGCREVGKDEVCQIMGGTRKDGEPCLFGFCSNGKCVDSLGGGGDTLRQSRSTLARGSHGARRNCEYVTVVSYIFISLFVMGKILLF